MGKMIKLLLAITISLSVANISHAETKIQAMISTGGLSATCESSQGDECKCKGACIAGTNSCECVPPDEVTKFTERFSKIGVKQKSPDYKKTGAKPKLTAPGPLSATCTSTDGGSTCNCPKGLCTAREDSCGCTSTDSKIK